MMGSNFTAESRIDRCLDSTRDLVTGLLECWTKLRREKVHVLEVVLRELDASCFT